MSIRTVLKDHLHEHVQANPLVIQEIEVAPAAPSGDPLVFWTQNADRPVRLDLREFAIGRSKAAAAGGPSLKWRGGFSGRPELISELAPAIRERLVVAAPGTVGNMVTALRAWWRLFDAIEATPASPDGKSIAPVKSVASLSHLHAQRALQTFASDTFCSFYAVAETTRRAAGLSTLAWRGPEQPHVTSDVPEAKRMKPLFMAIKHGWYAALDRWGRTDSLLRGESTASKRSEELVFANATFFNATLQALNSSHATATQLCEHYKQLHGVSRVIMNRRGINSHQMYSAFYPNPQDIRMAFHLSLSACGWNVSTMLDLKVDVEAECSAALPFLRQNPNNDPQEQARGLGRYVLTGLKRRGDSYHDVHGDWKSTKSPGFIIKTLVERTWPLRVELLRQLALAKSAMADSLTDSTHNEQRDSMRRKMLELKRASTSVWLYVDKNGIQALTNQSYSGKDWLQGLIEQVNADLSKSRRMPIITASDFRDIYAMWVYEETGGNILAVRRALNHRRVSTTAGYLWTNALNSNAGKRLLKFENFLWKQICEQGRIDSTLLRQMMEHGSSTTVQIVRLEEYRALKKSRLGIGCSDPYNPPPYIDRQSHPGSLCATHRCTLCAHAHVGTDSLDGLAMRLAELLTLQSSMPVEHFSRGDDSSFATELENTELVLSLFSSKEVEQRVQIWMEQIEAGRHRIPEFAGTAGRDVRTSRSLGDIRPLLPRHREDDLTSSAAATASRGNQEASINGQETTGI